MYLYRVSLGNVMLPIAPKKITMKINNNNKTMDLINGNEINFLRTQGLTEFSFDFLIPHVRYPFAEYPDGFQPAQYYVELLETLKKDKAPFTFNIHRTLPSGKVLFDTSEKVSLEEYTTTEDAGEGFDLTASVKLKQYQELKTIVNTIVQHTGNKAVVKEEKKRASDKKAPSTYKVKKGDSLWKICRSQLGDGSKYKEIAKLNSISNPNKIYPGQVIKLGAS